MAKLNVRAFETWIMFMSHMSDGIHKGFTWNKSLSNPNWAKYDIQYVTFTQIHIHWTSNYASFEEFNQANEF